MQICQINYEKILIAKSKAAVIPFGHQLAIFLFGWFGLDVRVIKKKFESSTKITACTSSCFNILLILLENLILTRYWKFLIDFTENNLHPKRWRAQCIDENSIQSNVHHFLMIFVNWIQFNSSGIHFMEIKITKIAWNVYFRTH